MNTEETVRKILREIADNTSGATLSVGNVGLTNTSDVRINPATEDKQNSTLAELQTLNSLVPSVYDYISMSYTDGDLTGVIFKTGGSGGTTVSTLTLAYTDGNLTSVTKS